MLSTTAILEPDLEVSAWVAAICAYTLFRTLRPISYVPSNRTTLAIVAEAGFICLGAASTDYWQSPVAFALLPAVAVAGFVSGFSLGVRVAVATSLAISMPLLLDSTAATEDTRLSSQWAVMLVLVALVAGYARRISGAADERHSAALDQLGKLADANQLLTALHRVAQDLPASLDLDEVLDAAIRRLQDLVDFDTAVVLLNEDADETWTVVRSHGAHASGSFGRAEEPAVLRQAAQRRAPFTHPDLHDDGDGAGIAARSRSGVYASLWARGQLIGVIALEHREPDHFSARDVEVLRGVAEPLALSVDNARWFRRLRTVGADEERTRIARDLHDRVGQSLAYIAFELDRVVRRTDDPVLLADLERLRGDARELVKEVRDTLQDLRTDVSDDRTVAEVLAEFVERVEARTGLRVTLDVEESERLPRAQERELWRIAQEAIVNVERHAHADALLVTWRSDRHGAIVEVADDGVGFPPGTPGRPDSYGLVGMRERAASIGARLDIRPRDGGGTTVRATLRRT